MPHDWLHTIIEIFGLALTVYVITGRNKRDAKRDNDKREATQIARHQQNQEKLNYLVVERMFLKPHFHQETEGALMAEGIVKRENGGIPSG